MNNIFKEDNMKIIYDFNLELNIGEIKAVKCSCKEGKALLEIASGQKLPSSGQVKIMGKPVKLKDKKIFYSMGVLMQGSGVYSRLTVFDYLKSFAAIYGIPKKDIEETIEFFGLAYMKNKKISFLNDNDLSKLHLARVCIQRPKFLILEEPTFRIDVETTELLRRKIIQLAEGGTAILIITTSREEAEALAQKVIYLIKGRIDRVIDLTEEQDDTSLRDKIILQKIPAKVNEKTILFDPMEIVFIESDEGCSLLHTRDESFQCALTLGQLAGRLEHFGFYRCHRSYIVNLQFVREIIPWSRNSYSLVVDDVNKTKIPLSKYNLKELQEKLGI